MNMDYLRMRRTIERALANKNEDTFADIIDAVDRYVKHLEDDLEYYMKENESLLDEITYLEDDMKRTF